MVVKILMKASLSGPGRCWIGGRTYETDAEEAANLVAGGIAEYASEPPTGKPAPPPPTETEPVVEPEPSVIDFGDLLRDVEGIPPRTLALLEAEGITTVEEYLALEDPTAIKGIGKVTANDIRERITAQEG